MFLPPTFCGRPAFGWTEIGSVVSNFRTSKRLEHRLGADGAVHSHHIHSEMVRFGHEALQRGAAEQSCPRH